MWTLSGITVLFLVVSAGVIVLARDTTARWERERQEVQLRQRAALRRMRWPSTAPRAGVRSRRGEVVQSAGAADESGGPAT